MSTKAVTPLTRNTFSPGPTTRAVAETDQEDLNVMAATPVGPVGSFSLAVDVLAIIAVIALIFVIVWKQKSKYEDSAHDYQR